MSSINPMIDEKPSDEDVQNSNLSKKEPTMMKINRLFDLLANKNRDTKQISYDEAIEARNELCNKNYLSLKFPSQVRSNVDPPIESQNLCVVNFIPSPKAVPDNDGCYGIVKFRGAFSDERSADNWTETIIRKADSLNTNYYVKVGNYFPLMQDASSYTEKNREVNLRKKIDDTVKNNVKKQRDQEQEDMNELKRRQELLLKESGKATIKDNVNSKEEETKDSSKTEEDEPASDPLDDYIKLRVKKAHLQSRIEQCEQIIKDSKKAIENVKEELKEKDEKYPEYKKSFLQRYKETLEKTGIDINSSPYIKYMIDESTTLEMSKPMVELKTLTK